MDWQLVLFLAGVIVTLGGTAYAALQYEIRKLRKQGHRHANALTALNIGMSMACKKIGIEWSPAGKKDEE